MIVLLRSCGLFHSAPWLRSWRWPPPSAFLLLCNAKALHYRENKVFKDLATYSQWPKGADALIEAKFNFEVQRLTIEKRPSDLRSRAAVRTYVIK